MATDYDAPRKNDNDDTESIEALKERVPDKLSGAVDAEDADNPGGLNSVGQIFLTLSSMLWCSPLRMTNSPV